MAIQSFRSPRKNRGFSLIEVCLGLAIASTQAAALFVAVSANEQRVKARASAEDLQQTVASIHALYGYSGGVPSTKQLLKARMVPLRAVKDGAWVSSWNTPVSVASGKTGWVVSYQGLDQSACVALLSEVVNQQVPGLMEVRVGPETIGLMNKKSAEKACASSQGLDVAFFVSGKNHGVGTGFQDPAKKRWGTSNAL